MLPTSSAKVSGRSDRARAVGRSVCGIGGSAITTRPMRIVITMAAGRSARGRPTDRSAATWNSGAASEGAAA